jgi:hypothetical protein
MNPIFTLLIKQLPTLLPVVKSMLDRPASQDTEEGRLAVIEQYAERLAERLEAVERRLKRLTVMVTIGVLLSLVAFVMMLTR